MFEVLMKGTPAGSVGFGSSNGWINSELFLKWLHHFIMHVKPTPSNPVFLVMDGHSSHKTLEAIELAKENGVIMIAYPHTPLTACNLWT
jgi:hypothetical protein